MCVFKMKTKHNENLGMCVDVSLLINNINYTTQRHKLSKLFLSIYPSQFRSICFVFFLLSCSVWCCLSIVFCFFV